MAMAMAMVSLRLAWTHRYQRGGRIAPFPSAVSAACRIIGLEAAVQAACAYCSSASSSAAAYISFSPTSSSCRGASVRLRQPEGVFSACFSLHSTIPLYIALITAWPSPAQVTDKTATASILRASPPHTPVVGYLTKQQALQALPFRETRHFGLWRIGRSTTT